MKIAYFDCFAGAAGDMITAAFLDAGMDRDFLLSQLQSLDIDSLEIKIEETIKCSLRALKFEPKFPEQHSHRNLKDVSEIIKKSSINNNAKQTAIDIFTILAKAEGKVHNKPFDEIYFHEIGAIDSIVDIVSAAICYNYFKENETIEKFFCSTISTGSGSTKTAHGIIPVPGPATTEIIRGIPVKAGPAEFELLTPTGAAILATITDEFCPLPQMKIDKIGCGAGTMDPKHFPNFIRLILGDTETTDQTSSDRVCLLETNIDDQSPEVISFALELLTNNGALDVYTMPVYMKHNRPAVKLSVICKPSDQQKLSQIIFEQGLTLGIRKQTIERNILERKIETIETTFGPIRIKIGKLGKKILSVKPDYSDCKACAVKHNKPIKDVMNTAVEAYNKTNIVQ